MKPYPIQLEISGPTAMWTRPHACQGVFNRALDATPSPPRPGRGQGEVSSFRFSAAPDYFGPLRPKTRVCETENYELPTMR
ncbi:MAG TPA: hypothetical protein VGK40_10700, partial [Verrucomicrobiae bacterium]